MNTVSKDVSQVNFRVFTGGGHHQKGDAKQEDPSSHGPEAVLRTTRSQTGLISVNSFVKIEETLMTKKKI